MAPDSRPSLVLVLGVARSGTSTLAGALAHSGYAVPEAITGNETNPSGFFEPQWAVDFHRRLLQSRSIRTLDTDPDALSLLAPVLGSDEVRGELREWLAPRLELGHVVIKDPRMVWFHDLWVSTAAELGARHGSVVMLRHPSEVAASHRTYYNVDEVAAVAGWVNVALTTERLTAGTRRALVEYPELLADWRGQLTRVADLLDLELDPAPQSRPHPVDEFIDPGLRRMPAGWADSTVPAFLRDLAERTHAAMGRLAAHPEDPAADHAVAGLREEYAEVHRGARIMTRATTMRARDVAVAKGRAAVRRKIAAERAAQDAARGEDHPPGDSGDPSAQTGAIRRLRRALRRP